MGGVQAPRHCTGPDPDSTGRVSAYNVVDRPGGRTVHAYLTPRVGGVSIAVAYAATVRLSGASKALVPDYYSEALELLPGVLIIFLTGLLDDFLNLRPAFKLPAAPLPERRLCFRPANRHRGRLFTLCG